MNARRDEDRDAFEDRLDNAMSVLKGGDTECIDCGLDAEGSTCDICGEPLCHECIMGIGAAVCGFCDSELEDGDA